MRGPMLDRRIDDQNPRKGVQMTKRMINKKTALLPCVLAVFFALATIGCASAEVSELRITKQPSIIYLPLVVMEQNKLVEKHAKAAGLPEFKMTWVTFNSGGAATDALLSGSVDLVTSGVSNMLLLWERTKGQVNGVTSVGGLPMLLVTRDPNVKTLKDFTDKDKIAVPTIKVSSQAMVLKMAMEKMYGEASRDKLDPMTIQLGHPDAMIAVVNGSSEVNSHFSAPPYQYSELRPRECTWSWIPATCSAARRAMRWSSACASSTTQTRKPSPRSSPRSRRPTSSSRATRQVPQKSTSTRPRRNIRSRRLSA